MFSFYGDLSCAAPCLICDSGMRILFANTTAYSEPLTAKWINLGTPHFDSKLTEKLEKAFQDRPHSIARLDIRRNGTDCILLADKHTVCGTTVYVLAIAREESGGSDSLPTELDCRRMITSCFFPDYGKTDIKTPLDAKTAELWAEIACKAAAKAGKSLTVDSRISVIGSPLSKSNAFLCCATAVLAAFCGDAKGKISAELNENRFGVSITFCAEMLSSSGACLTSCKSASVISACFAHSAMPMLVAIQTAENCGFSLIADTRDGTELAVTVRAEKFDTGDIGFKLPTEYPGNLINEIYAVSEMLI